MKKHLLKSLITFCITVSFSLNAISQTPIKKVLIEEFTTASCGNCPMMSAWINDWQTANSSNCVLMAIHEGSGNDAMSNNLTDAIFNAMHPTGSWFAPATMINRGVYPSTNGEAYLSCYNSWGSGTGIGVDTIATRLMNEPAAVGVEISGTYNSATRVINATVDVNFVSQVPSGDWRINLFLVEDSVIGYPNLGPFAGWDQHCYDPNWANSHYPGMFDGTSIIGYPHRHVMRSSFFGNWGVAGIIPASPVVGVSYSATANLTIDTAYKDHFSLVAFVSSYGASKTQKYVLNANSVELSSNFTTGIIENTDIVQTISLFPNPTKGYVTISSPDNIDELQITDLLGQVLFQKKSSGRNISLRLDRVGMYFVNLTCGEKITTHKLVVEK